jgi:membrane protease subunit (stomatin/prohibitin family)
MGLIRAAAGALGGSLADQWIDFFTVPSGISQTAAIFPAVLKGVNAGRGSDTKASLGIITNGSRIVIPEGYGLMTFQDGELTSLVTTPGAYIWNSESVESQSLFLSGEIVSTLVNQSWNRFKYGGRPSSQQLALFVSLKELPNNKFGTQNAIYWDDSYLNTQAGATARGTYTLKIIDPVLFARNFLPANYLQNGATFDFLDSNNEVADQIFNEVVASLAPAFSSYANDPSKSNRISGLQRDSIGLSKSLAQAIEEAFQWRKERGITLVKAAILGIDYDERTKSILSTIQRADALMGSRGSVNLQASMAAGLEAAGNAEGAAGIIGLAIAGGGAGISSLQQQADQQSHNSADRDHRDPEEPSQSSVSLVRQLEQLKQALDAGLISSVDYDNAKSKVLGLS